MEIKDFLITEEVQIIEAVQRLDTLGKKTLFLIRDGRLIGTLTDGDVRRWLLKGGNLEISVKEIVNYKPKFIWEKDKLTAYQKLREWKIEALPVLNEEKQIISIILWDNEEICKGQVLNLPIVIMAGGLGTRLFPYTKILPKPLIPIGELPIAEHIINRFHGFGANDFYLIVNHKKNMIKAYFNEIDKSYQVHYIDEEKPLGTGGGLSLLKNQIDSTFILSNCDILVEADYEAIYQFHKKNRYVITMVCAEQKIKIPYGVIHTNKQGEIIGMEEKPEICVQTNTGFYVVEPKVIEEMEENKAIGFPDVIEKYRQNGNKVGAYKIGQNQWWDMGQIDKMEKMERYLEGEQ
ncbi:nucleotidyltransferase [Clostridiales bacterium COT073_COT-073]|nr:nucleotidyltransferase [Clostridiales bacterium COT073_COT-073]